MINNRLTENEAKILIWKQIVEGELREKIAKTIESVEIGSLNGLGMQIIAAKIAREENSFIWDLESGTSIFDIAAKQSNDAKISEGEDVNLD